MNSHTYLDLEGHQKCMDDNLVNFSKNNTTDWGKCVTTFRLT